MTPRVPVLLASIGVALLGAATTCVLRWRAVPKAADGWMTVLPVVAGLSMLHYAF